MRRIISTVVAFAAFVGLGYAQTWETTEHTNAMDSVKTVFAEKDSSESPKATLVIRCTGKQVQVYVHTPEVISEEYGVRIKFDTGKPVKQSWERATNYQGLFSPMADDFLRSMKSARTFYFEYTPFQHVATTVSFDVANLPQSMLNSCVSAAIGRAEAREKRAREEQTKRLAQEREEQAEQAKNEAALRTKCAPFADETVEQVIRMQSPLPPEECWERLGWMRNDPTLSSYEKLAERRSMCELPSFAKDPSFCGALPSQSSEADSSPRLNDQLINNAMDDHIAKEALKENCAQKWFANEHAKACKWVMEEAGK
jgi:hypothetical protein